MPYLTQLIEGYRRFRETDWARERERWSELAEGQSPQVMILSCADSRVDPAQIFDARPGEMFVVRNIAALAPPYETSRRLSRRLGGPGVRRHAAQRRRDHRDGAWFVRWLRGSAHWPVRRYRARRRAFHLRLGPHAATKPATRCARAIQSSIAAAFTDMEQEAVKVSLANLRTFPWIAEREAGGRAEAARRSLLDLRKDASTYSTRRKMTSAPSSAT